MKVGDNVAWESQSGGSWTKKKGTIVAIVQAGNSAQKLVPMTARKSHIKFDADISRTGFLLQFQRERINRLCIIIVRQRERLNCKKSNLNGGRGGIHRSENK